MVQQAIHPNARPNLHHSIRTHAPLDYELIAYFEADQPLPQRGQATPPWDYTDIEAALIHYAALPVTTARVCGITVHPPCVHIRGRRALLKQRIGSLIGSLFQL